jgi:hypothetical protein
VVTHCRHSLIWQRLQLEGGLLLLLLLLLLLRDAV